MEKDDGEEEMSEEIIPRKANPQSVSTSSKVENFDSTYSKYFNSILNQIKTRESQQTTQRSKRNILDDIDALFDSHKLDPNNQNLHKICGWLLCYLYGIAEERNRLIKTVIELPNPFHKPTYQESLLANNHLCKNGNLQDMFLSKLINANVPREETKIYVAFVDTAANNISDFFGYPYASKYIGQAFSHNFNDMYFEDIDDEDEEGDANSNRKRINDVRSKMYSKVKERIDQTENQIRNRFKLNATELREKISEWSNNSSKLTTPYGNVSFEDEIDIVKRGYVPHLTQDSALNSRIASDLADSFGQLCIKLNARSGVYTEKYADILKIPTTTTTTTIAQYNVDDDEFVFPTKEESNQTNNTIRYQGSKTKDKATKIILPESARYDPPLWGEQYGWVKEGQKAAFVLEFESPPDDAEEQMAQYVLEPLEFDYSTKNKVMAMIVGSMIPLEMFMKQLPSTNIANHMVDVEEWWEMSDKIKGMSCLWSKYGKPSNGRMVYYARGADGGVPASIEKLETQDFPAESFQVKPTSSIIDSILKKKKGKEKVAISNRFENVDELEVQKIWNDLLPNAVGVLHNTEANINVILLDIREHTPFLTSIREDLSDKDNENDQLVKNIIEFTHELIFAYPWHMDIQGNNNISIFNRRDSPYKDALIMQKKECNRSLFTLVQEATFSAAKELTPQTYGLNGDPVDIRKNITRINTMLFNIIHHDVMVILRKRNLTNNQNVVEASEYLQKLQKFRLLNCARIFEFQQKYDISVQIAIETIVGLYNISAWAQHYMQKIDPQKLDEMSPTLFMLDYSTGRKRSRQGDIEPPKPSIIVISDDDEQLMDTDDEEEDDDRLKRNTKRRKFTDTKMKFIESIFKKVENNGNNDKGGSNNKPPPEQKGKSGSLPGPPKPKKRKRDDSEISSLSTATTSTTSLVPSDDSPSSTSTGSTLSSFVIPPTPHEEKIDSNAWNAFESYVAQQTANDNFPLIQRVLIPSRKILWTVPKTPVIGFGDQTPDARYSYNLTELLRSEESKDNMSMGTYTSAIFTEPGKIITPSSITIARNLETDPTLEYKTKAKGKDNEVAAVYIYKTLSEFQETTLKWIDYSKVFIASNKFTPSAQYDFKVEVDTRLRATLDTIDIYKNTIKITTPEYPITSTSSKITGGDEPTFPGFKPRGRGRPPRKYTTPTKPVIDIETSGNLETLEKQEIESTKQSLENRCFRSFKAMKVRNVVDKAIGLESLLSKIFTEVGLRTQYNYDPSIQINDNDGTRIVQQNSDVDYISSLPKQALLLYGPPGVGKTLVVTSFAGELAKSGIGTLIFSESATNLRGSYLGETAANILCLFETAEREARLAEIDAKVSSSLTNNTLIPKIFRSIIFLDEFEIIAKERSNEGSGSIGGDGGKEESQAATNALLTALDGISKYPHVIFVAATNLPSQIDAALRRRITHTILVDIPTDISREIKLHMDIYRNTLPHAPGEADSKIRNWMTVFEDTIAAREIAQLNNLVTGAKNEWEDSVKHYSISVERILSMIGATTLAQTRNQQPGDIVFGKQLTADYISSVIVPQLGRRTLSISAIFKRMDIPLNATSLKSTSQYSVAKTMTFGSQEQQQQTANTKTDANIAIDDDWIQKQQSLTGQALDQLKRIRPILRIDLESRLLNLDHTTSARSVAIKNVFDKNKLLVDQLKLKPKTGTAEADLLNKLIPELDELDKKVLSPLGYTLNDISKLVTNAFQNTFNRALVMPVPLSVLASWGVYGKDLQDVFNISSLVNGKTELNTDQWLAFAGNNDVGNRFKEHVAAYLRIAVDNRWGSVSKILVKDKDKMEINDDNNSGNVGKTLLDLISISKANTNNVWKDIILNEAFVFLPSNNIEWEQIRSALIESNQSLPINWDILRSAANNLFANFSYDQRQKMVLTQFVTERDFDLSLKYVKSSSSIATYAQAVQFNNDPDIAIREARSGIGPYISNNNNQ